MNGRLILVVTLAVMVFGSARVVKADWSWGQVDKNGNINLYDQKGNWSWGQVDKDGNIYMYDQKGNWFEGVVDGSGKFDMYDQEGNRSSWGQMDRIGNIDIYQQDGHYSDGRVDDSGKTIVKKKDAAKNSRHAPKSSKSRIFVTAGGSVTIKMDAKPMKKVYIKDPGIADIRVLTPYNLEVTGKSKGVTSLKIWDTDGDNVVYTVIVT